MRFRNRQASKNPSLFLRHDRDALAIGNYIYRLANRVACRRMLDDIPALLAIVKLYGDERWAAAGGRDDSAATARAGLYSGLIHDSGSFDCSHRRGLRRSLRRSNSRRRRLRSATGKCSGSESANNERFDCCGIHDVLLFKSTYDELTAVNNAFSKANV
jgi:hypothetical protein